MFDGVQPLRITTPVSQLGGRVSSVEGTLVHAHVVDSSGGKALLRIEGQLVLADTQAPLRANSDITLVVRGVEAGRILMQVVSSRGEPVRALSNADISSRLAGFDLPEGETTIAAARSLIAQNLPVTRENILNILHSLAPGPTAEQTGFLAAALREGLPVTRGMLPLRVFVEVEMERFPLNLRDFVHEVGQFLKGSAAFGRESAVAAISRIAHGIPSPGEEPAAAVARKIAAFACETLHPTEARLASAVLPPSHGAQAAPAADALVENLLFLLLFTRAWGTKPDADTVNVLETVAGQIETVSEPRVRALALDVSQILKTIVSGKNLEQAFRELEPKTMRLVLEVLRLNLPAEDEPSFPSRDEVVSPQPGVRAPEGSPSPVSDPGARLFPVAYAALRDLLDGIPSAGEPAKVWHLLREVILRLNMHVLPEVMRASSGGEAPLMIPGLKPLVDWLVRALRAAADAPPEPPRELTIEAQALLLQLRNTLNALRASTSPGLEPGPFERAQETQDTRALISQLMRAEGVPEALKESAAAAGRGFQAASLAGLLEHNGSNPTGAVMVFCPIQFGDRTDVARISVKSDPDRRKKGLPLDPFNASLLIALDTEFLGHSLTRLDTFQKGIRCVIEVDSKRKKKIVSGYAWELEEALRRTVYEDALVEVRVRKRIKGTGGVEAEGSPMAVDMRV
ncbi:MAG: hypothetical protein AB1742_06530 [bacterium]